MSLDQLYAQRFGQDTAIPSMQLCIENVDQAGGCGYGYSCVYTDAISWAAANRPMPMIRDPRLVFDKLFSVLKVGTTQASARNGWRRTAASSTGCSHRSRGCRRHSGRPIKARLADYLEHVREIERRIQIVEARNRSGELRELPAAPAGVPDSFGEHVKLMFDLQMLAFASDITRVFAFKLGRDARTAATPRADSRAPSTTRRTTADARTRFSNFAKINTFHVGMMPYLLAELKETPDGDGTLLDHTLSDLRIADGRLEPAQSQARAVLHRRPRGRRAQGRGPPQSAERHAAGRT